MIKPEQVAAKTRIAMLEELALEDLANMETVMRDHGRQCQAPGGQWRQEYTYKL